MTVNRLVYILETDRQRVRQAEIESAIDMFASVSFCVRPSLSLSVCLSVRSSVCPPVCPSVRLSVRLSLALSLLPHSVTVATLIGTIDDSLRCTQG